MAYLGWLGILLGIVQGAYAVENGQNLENNNVSIEMINKLKKMPINYGFTARASGQHCTFYINDVPIQDTLEEEREPLGSTIGYSIGNILENGVNEIKILAVGDFDRKKGPEQYCEIELDASKAGVFSKVISHIRVELDEDGKLTAQNSKQLPEREAIEKTIDETVQKSVFYKEEGINDRLITRKIIITGLPEFIWTKASAYTDSMENKKALIAAYDDIRQLFNNKDLKTLFERYQPALKEDAELVGGTAQEFFDSYVFNEAVNAKDFKILPVNYDHYNVVTFNKGRLIQLQHNEELDSPINYEFIDNEGGYDNRVFQPFFSLVNGRFVLSR